MVAIYPIDWYMPEIKHLYLAVFVVALALLITLSTVPLSREDAVIAGQVLDRAGRPVPYATLVAREMIRAEVAQVRTQADGAYALNNLHPGTYTLWASAYGYKTKPLGRLTAAAGHRLRLEVVLEQFASLVLKDSDARPGGDSL